MKTRERLHAPARQRILTAWLMLAFLWSGWSTGAAGKPVRPEWISHPKTSDSIYLYMVGCASGQASESEARDAAFQNALENFAKRLSLPDGPAVPTVRIRRAEIVPGCIHIESSRKGFDAWVQVSWPVREQAQLEKTLSAGTTGRPHTPDDTTTPATPDGPGTSSAGRDRTADNANSAPESSPGLTQSARGITVQVPEGIPVSRNEIRITAPAAREDFSPYDNSFRTLATMDIAVGTNNVFTQDIVIRTAYNSQDLNPQLTPAEQISGWRWDEGAHQWARVPVQVDEQNQSIITRTRHLCTLKWITEGVGALYNGGKPYLTWAANSFFQTLGSIPHTTYEWTMLNRPRMSAAFRVLCDSDNLAQSACVGDAVWAKKRKGAPIPAQRGIPLFVWDLGSALDESMEVYTNRLGLTPPDLPIVVKIDSWVVKQIPGGAPGCFEPDYNRIHIKSDVQDSWSAANIKFRAAHELFHAFQHLAIGQRWFDHPYVQTKGTYLWWAEACADFAAGRIATKSRHLIGHGNIYPKLLDYPIVYTGAPPDPNYKELEYDKAWFIDYLVNTKKVSFKDMHLAVASRAAPNAGRAMTPADSDQDPVIGNLDRFLQAQTGAGLPKVYRDFTAYFLFSKDSITLADMPQADCAEKFEVFPLPAQAGSNAAPILHTFTVPAPCAIRLWAVKPQIEISQDGKPTDRSLTVQLKQTDPDLAVDVFMLPKNAEAAAMDGATDVSTALDKPAGQPAPAATLAKADDTAQLTVGPHDIIFVVAANTGFKNPAQAVVSVTDAPAGTGCWEYVETKFQKTEADKPAVITDNNPNSLIAKTEVTPSFTAAGGEGFVKSEFRSVSKEYTRKGEVRTHTRHCVGEVRWELDPPAKTLIPGQKVRATLKVKNSSEGQEFISCHAVFTKADIPITHGYEAEVPIVSRKAGENIPVGSEKPLLGEGVVPEPRKILFKPETEQMAIRFALDQCGRAMVDRVYRWVPGSVTVTNLPPR